MQNFTIYSEKVTFCSYILQRNQKRLDINLLDLTISFLTISIQFIAFVFINLFDCNPWVKEREREKKRFLRIKYWKWLRIVGRVQLLVQFKSCVMTLHLYITCCEIFIVTFIIKYTISVVVCNTCFSWARSPMTRRCLREFTEGSVIQRKL